MDFAVALTDLMTERGIGVRALARRIPCDPGLISKLASGKQAPSRQMAARLDDALQAEGRLTALAGTRAEPAPDDEDVNRRTFLGLGLSGTVALAAQAERLRVRLDTALDAPASSADAEEWEHAAWDYAIQVGHAPPELIISDLLTDLQEAQSRLTDCPASLRPRLTRVCGQFAALAAIALLGVGDPGSARRYWRTAIRAADQSADRHLQALLRGRRAVFALYDRHPLTSVLQFADDAIAVAGDLPCAGQASGHAARAQALARLGRHPEARDALHDLDDVFTQLPEPTASDRMSQWGWAETRLHWVHSDVYSLAGLQHEAATAQQAALALFPASAYQAPAQVELHRSTCLIVTGDPAEGARHAMRTLQALPTDCHRDVLVRHTAALALSKIPPRARRLPDVVQARELLALPAGQS
jgi:transcriptional regulator with XRE-family HTH domain